MLPLWGMIGIWTDQLGWVTHLLVSGQGLDITPVYPNGYHNRWEFWGLNLVSALFQAPYYSYSQTTMADLTPPGFDFMVRAVRKSRSHMPPLIWEGCPGECSSLACSG